MGDTSDPNSQNLPAHEYADTPRRRDLLLQAYEMRTLILLIDGMDEGAGLREVVRL